MLTIYLCNVVIIISIGLKLMVKKYSQTCDELQCKMYLSAANLFILISIIGIWCTFKYRWI